MPKNANFNFSDTSVQLIDNQLRLIRYISNTIYYIDKYVIVI